MASVRAALDLVLAAYEPFPALVVDRAWHLVAANGALAGLLDGTAVDLTAAALSRGVRSAAG